MEVLEQPYNELQPLPVDYTTNQVLLGPLAEAGSINAGLDYYKPKMSHMEYDHYPDVEATFSFKNRGINRLADYVDIPELQLRLDAIQARGWSDDEIGYYRGLHNSSGDRVFSDSYLDYLVSNELPRVEVKLDEETNDLAIDAKGSWPLVTFWETIVMSEVNEVYFEGYVAAQGLDLFELYAEGDRILDTTIGYFQAHPELKFSDFGTRRRFSLRWHEHVVQRLATECPDNFIGTSNVALAAKLGLKPIGTVAHEMAMGYAAIADATGGDIRNSQSQMFDDLLEFDPDSPLLIDTFTSDFSFATITKEQAEKAIGLRQDSGDPIEFAEKAIRMYEKLGIDPTTKLIVFSDALNIDKVDRIQRHLADRIKFSFGIGTNLSNNLGLDALNVVMKLTHVKTLDGREANGVKRSDNERKHTGPLQDVARYVGIFAVNQELLV